MKTTISLQAGEKATILGQPAKADVCAPRAAVLFSQHAEHEGEGYSVVGSAAG